MNDFVASLQKLGPAKLAAMGIVTLALIGFFVYVGLRMAAPNMSVLYTDLPLSDASSITRELDSQNIKYELRNDGSTILVPQDQVATLRMKMAESGLPAGGGVGYEIFDKSDGLSATSFLQNVNRLRALEGELARSIRSIDRVASARVHLVVPERPLFSRDAVEPSASIVLRVRGTLGNQQIRAIQHLAASAVQGLKPERISIVDETGNLLADGAQAQDIATLGEERVAGLERRMKSQIEGMIERIVGTGRARAEVRAEMDYSRLTETSDQFDPESRVIRSNQTSEENSEITEAEQGVTVGNELPNAQANQQANAGPKERSNKADETTNYEISRTTRTQTYEAGRLKRLTVAVVVDGVYTTNANGEVTYTPRTQGELDQIAALVRSAVGFDEQRGDKVDVVNLRYAVPPGSQLADGAEGALFLGLTKDDLMALTEKGVLLVLALLVILLVVRPVLKRLTSPQPSTAEVAKLGNAGGAEGEMTALPAPEDENALAPVGAAARMIDLAQVNGQVQAQSIQRVGELAANNPNETVSIIRQWLAEPA